MCPPPDKHNVVDYSAIEKKWSSDTYYSMGEPQKHYARWNKSDTEWQEVFYVSTYMMNKQTHRNRK